MVYQPERICTGTTRCISSIGQQVPMACFCSTRMGWTSRSRIVGLAARPWSIMSLGGYWTFTFLLGVKRTLVRWQGSTRRWRVCLLKFRIGLLGSISVGLGIRVSICAAFPFEMRLTFIPQTLLMSRRLYQDMQLLVSLWKLCGLTLVRRFFPSEISLNLSLTTVF